MSDQENLEPEADVEAHKMKFKVDGPDTDEDVEGHLRAPGGGRAEGADDEDVEGHLRAPGGGRAEGADDDDVEGHRFKVDN